MKEPFFVDSSWKFRTSEGADVGLGTNLFSVTGSSGSLYLDSPAGYQYQFNYLAAGASVGIGIPLSFDISTQDLFSTGIVYANTLESETLSTDSITGACLIYQGTGISLPGAGGVGSIVFLNVGLGLAASWTAFVATGGLSGAVTPAIVIASCSGFVAYAGMVLGSSGASVSGALGWLSLHEGD